LSTFLKYVRYVYIGVNCNGAVVAVNKCHDDQ